MTLSQRQFVNFYASLAGAVLIAIACITMLWREAQTNPDDMMFGEPLWAVLLNPFVLTFATPVVAASAVVAFLLTHYWLRESITWTHFLFLYAVALAEVVAVGLIDPVAAWLASYPTLVAAVGLIKWLRGRHPGMSNAT